MRMRNNTTPYRGKTLISTLWDAIGWTTAVMIGGLAILYVVQTLHGAFAGG